MIHNVLYYKVYCFQAWFMFTIDIQSKFEWYHEKDWNPVIFMNFLKVIFKQSDVSLKFREFHWALSLLFPASITLSLQFSHERIYHMKEFFHSYWLSFLKVVRFEGMWSNADKTFPFQTSEWIPLAQANIPSGVHKSLVPFHGYCDATATSKPWEMNGQENPFHWVPLL